MNKTYTLSILLLLFILALESTKAQNNYVEGYIVNKQNDTVRGQINDQNWAKTPKHIYFKANANSEAIKYSPEAILGFYTQPNNEHHVSYIGKIDDSVLDAGELINVAKDAEFFQKDYSKTDTIFLRTVLRGKINLYIYIDKKDRVHFFFQQDNAPVVELINQKYLLDSPTGTKLVRTNPAYRKQLREALAMCTSLENDLKNIEYKQNALTKLISKYHTCVKENIAYLSKKEAEKLEIGLVAGMSASSLQVINATERTDYGTSINPSAGISFNFVFPRMRQSLSIYADILWRSLNFHKDVETLIGLSSRELQAHYIKGDILLRYTLPTHTQNVRPFLNAGIANNFAVQMDQNIFRIGGNSFDEARKHERGFLGGVGVRVGKWQGEVRYERSNGMSPYQSWNSPIRTWYLLLTYQFK